jgi:alginate O-acetyltransferase complex protein AlgI
MLFNSLEFAIFFPVVTLLYFLVPFRFRWLHLLIASSIFYAAVLPGYLLILFSLILVDYFAGLKIESTENKKVWLIVSIVINIGILSFFKYYNFFISNINYLSGSHFSLLHVVLPIGLSFHTFQSLSYTIEVYRGKQKAIKHVGYYALYVMFYPQLVAGPIERPYHLLPQLFQKHTFSSQNLYEGLRLMAWGFFKKVVIADRVSGYVDTIFDNPSNFNGGNIWVAVLFFTIQIYADFSGYSDIAIGAARCMGYNLSINFNRPYFAKNIADFWKRWHISLSSWFRDYVYIPLGGNRKGKTRHAINLLITFTLSGLWHGAGWTFIAWGLIHCIYVIVYNGFTGTRTPKNLKIQMPYISYLITFICVYFAWIFFRASSLESAFNIISKGFDFQNISLSSLTSINSTYFQYGNFSLLLLFVFISFMFIVEKFTTPLLLNLNPYKFTDSAFFTITILIIIFYGVFHKTSFIYYQF